MDLDPVHILNFYSAKEGGLTSKQQMGNCQFLQVISAICQ